MGNYNPSVPIILGNEWVGIRDENTQLSPQVNATELGHTFRTAQAYVLESGRFYVREFPVNTGTAIWQMALYPTGTEDRSGPVKRLILPTESVFISGGVVVSSGSALNALATPYMGSYLNFDGTDVDANIVIGFNTVPYTILGEKRILDVSLLLGIFRTFEHTNSVTGPFIYLSDSQAVGSGLVYSDGDEVPVALTTASLPPEAVAISYGEMCRYWQSPATSEMMPWKFADLIRFDSSYGGTRLYASIVGGTNWGMSLSSENVYVWYAALQVTYCEEQRTIIGGVLKNASNPIGYGANFVRLRGIESRALLPSLPAGDWTVTVATADQGAIANPRAGYPDLNALRELYEIPSHAGVQINVTTTPGEQFETVDTHVLTQLSVHTTGAALTEVHAYGRQYPSPVYGSNFVTQDVYDDAVAAGTYPQLRFWARHFNDTSQSLVVSGTGTAAGSVASISVSDFDNLPEILNGWREVNLRLSPAPTLGGLSPDAAFVWSSTAETAGSRWELLAVQAPAVSGIPGDLLNLVVPAGQRLPPVTYQPPSGETVEITTLSQYASGAAAQQTDTDLSFLFSQDPYTVTGLAVATLSQAVTGIGVDCNGTPCCIPTAITYNRITWPALAMAPTGFGVFELQRYDDVTAAWHTIMSASASGVTGFNDYEARVGQASVYRMRVLNLYRFAGSWSAQVTGTVTTPGVTMQCADSGEAPGVLIFTSNSVQSGTRNLAYAMQFDRTVEETFAFPEVDWQQLRRQYGRNFRVAYRPTERGGEVFNRVLLVQGAAGALPNMANIRSLRDLGWADLPYVCVRDELGNRWFANVLIPDGRVSQRSVYLANVSIAEVTDTPTEVNP